MEDIFTGVGAFHKNQDDLINAAADIFAPQTMEKATITSRESVHRPISENPEGPFEFYLPAESDTYVDPEGFRLSGYTQLVGMKDGSEIPLTVNTENVAPINFAPGMAFTMKELYMNGNLVNYATQPFDNIKSYIENQLSFGKEIKDTVLKTCAGWIPNTDGNAVSLKPSENGGFKTRVAAWKEGARVPFSIPLQLDVLNTDRFLPKGLDMHIKLTKASDAFLITADALPESTTAKLKITDLKLTSRRVTMSPTVVKNHESKFNSGQEAIYPFVRTDIKVFNVPKGSTEARTNNIYRKQIPGNAIVCFVESEALTGSYKTDPTVFKNHGIREVAFYCNSEKIGSYNQDYGQNDCAVSYRKFQDEIGVRTNNIGNDITAERWVESFNLYPFDFTSDKCSGYHNHLPMSGNLDFVVTFSAATTKALSMLILTQYDDEIRLDKNRNVVTQQSLTAI